MIGSRDTGPTIASIVADGKRVTKMRSTLRDGGAVLPPRPNFPYATAFGDGSAAAGLIALFSPFVTVRLFGHHPSGSS
jgi:hypothetical protein